MSEIAQVREVMEAQRELLVDRDTEIHLIWLAILSRQHTYFVGIPGTAKSMTVRDTVRRIEGACLFEKLFMKDTSRNEIFGNLSLRALKEDRFEYVTTNMLPEAHFAFLDEVGKASSAVTNMLLTVLNEREFDNGGRRIKVPLLSAFAASNELPEGEEQAAIFDRFLLRAHTRDLSDADFLTLLEREPRLSAEPKKISLTTLQALQEETDAVRVPGEVKNKLVDLRAALRVEAQAEFGPRRWLQGLSVVRAHALLSGRDEATEEDLEAYTHILWDSLEEKTRTAKVILGSINPLNVRFLDLMDAAETAYQEVKTEIDRKGENVQALALEHQANLRKALEELKTLAGQTTGSMLERVRQGYKQVKEYNKFVFTHGLGLGDDRDL